MSDEYVYVLRCCAPDMTSHDGFRWPESGPVEATCWDPGPHCGGGLHGWLWGCGDEFVAEYTDDHDARWLVVRVDAGSVVDLGGKVKFPGGEVVFCGDRAVAAAEIIRLGARGAVIGAVVTAGYRGTATAGYRGTATAGDGGTATAGDGGTASAGACGTASAGYRGTATAGDYGTATAGYRGTATAGDGGTATAGNGGTATSGNGGTATAGDGGTATAGDYGTATAGGYGTATAGEYGKASTGDGGTATAGDGGTATAGNGGEIRIRWWDGSRLRLAVGYVGEDGIKAGVPYVVRDGRIVKKEGGDA